MEAPRLLLGLALTCIFNATAFAQRAEDPQTDQRKGQPFEIARSMEATQDEIVLGSVDARSRLPKLIGQIAERLLAAEPSLWRDARNDHAAVIYTLSGGQPRVIRKVLQLGNASETERNLMTGALAYVEGQQAKAKQILMAIDAMALAPSVGGYVALAQSALIAKENPARAMSLLDQARVLAPGTLVEEAALRRSAFLADEMSDLGRFVTSSSQYFRRYARSVYADNFRRRFAESVAHFGLTSDAAQRAKLTNLLRELDSEEQLKLYLLTAQSGILKGKIEPARYAAEQAVRLSEETGLEKDRAKLYEAATKILLRSPEAGLREVAEIDERHLQKRDVELKEVVTKTGAEIQKTADDAQRPSDAGSAEPQSSSNGNDGPSPSALIESAQMALSQTDALLTRAGP